MDVEPYDPDRPDVWTWLQAWYVGQCNGVWEHSYGVGITTLDNPGWTVTIDLAETELDQTPYERRVVHRSEDDWCITWTECNVFTAACGPTNLPEVLHQFRQWATNHHRR